MNKVTLKVPFMNNVAFVALVWKDETAKHLKSEL